ncbi:MAG: hypothetical protein A2W00_08185 [Candidatus Eisenbacteria bacterium RBG_16_71_46]|nr:MAG: hypothetical protein A2W00_08185 [Candidatus Eisenbacteria bacterium RBG_16_71_46]OGF23421.1 MAG: hypothetical protein A2V63_13710 [Candidatus Eisenbacteria bacterium RBG_19FT_COMBO_70_11]
MTREERDRLVRQYAEGYDEVVRSLEGFPPASLMAHPLPGKWSAREIVHHLADSETVAGIRLRKLLSEEYPVLQAYDQEAYAILLRYNLREIEPALDAFRAARASTLQLLELMSEDDWTRSGWHPEHGLYAADRWLQIYADHAHNHAAQIRRLRAAVPGG